MLVRHPGGWGAIEGGAAGSALHDWAELGEARGRGREALEAARMALLRRGLTLPPANRCLPGTAVRVDRALRQVMGAMRGQMVPAALFEFHNFHEAFGVLSPEKRREAIERTTRTMRVPEVIGVAATAATEDESEGGARPSLLHAVAYRDRQFQRSQEEIWLVADLSAARSLTTPEVEAALEATEGRAVCAGDGAVRDVADRGGDGLARRGGADS